MIETQKFKQSQKTYFDIVLSTRIRKRWWLYILLIFAGIFHLYLYINTLNYTNLIWSLMCLLYPIIIYISLYRFAYLKNQKIFLSERKLSFNSEIFKITETDGSVSEVPYNKIVKIISKIEYWMLYLNKNTYIYIPKNIFYKKEDLETFEEYINR